MSVMALDLGERRTGVAVSDASKRVALPLKTLETSEVMGGTKVFMRLLEDYAVECFVVGLPLSLDGTEHEQAKRMRTQAAALVSRYGIPVVFTDERLSSAEARRVLRQMGYNDKSMRGRTDRIAACLFLQTWLDAQQPEQEQ